MKRGRPLRRRKELERGRELRADVEKVREFLKRGQEKGLRRSSAREGPLTPRQWRRAVFEASDGRCIVSGAQARNADDRRFTAHHPLPKRVLRERGYLDRVWDARNGVLLRRDIHVRHEDAFERIPAEKLPGSVWEFCGELDALEETRWATELVLRAHPPAGSSRGHSQ